MPVTQPDAAQAAQEASSVSVIPVDPDQDVGCSRDAASAWHWYRGTVACTQTAASTVRLVNTLDLEDYLAGVVGTEIGAGAPDAALQAQAVASRTYAVRNMGKLSAHGADLDDTTRCQSYCGDDVTAPAVVAAIEATRGMVLTYHGALIDAVFSTDCGGATAPGSTSEPYLQSVTDPWCLGRPDWKCSVSKAKLGQVLAPTSLSSPDKLDTLEVVEYDCFGRVQSIEVGNTDGDVRPITGSRLRQLLGGDLLRSTRFTIDFVKPDQFIFTGQGWGHGQGMCRMGAVAMAKSNSASYQQILQHYYTGVSIVPLTADLVPPAH